MTSVHAVELRVVALPLVRPFRTSFGVDTEKVCILVKVQTEDAEGWGECVAGPDPDYSEEFNEGALLVLRGFLIPALMAARDVGLEDLPRLFAGVRGNPMAKAALIDAFADAELRAQGQSMSSYLGGTKDEVECGVSVGIVPTVGELLDQVEGYLAEGYRRIKLKIEPGMDIERVAEVRRKHPDVMLSVDANAAYTLEDLETFHALDELELLMIEQPLHYEDMVDHAKLQSAIRTDVCLDESIRSAADASAAIQLRACRIINIKQGRVGGVLEAARVHNVAVASDTPVWCGGMLETGVGRALNLALSSMPGFSLPGDTSASSRYFAEDITQPFVLSPDGTMAVPKGAGIGVDPRPEALRAFTLQSELIAE